jgi:hypothetical protein
VRNLPDLYHKTPEKATGQVVIVGKNKLITAQTK